MGRRLDKRRRKTVSALSLAARKAGLVITITRRDALVCQLDTAIRMWFLGQDPLAIHLLVMPAYHVLRDLVVKLWPTYLSMFGPFPLLLPIRLDAARFE
jgi:hypothetical protein